MPKSEAQKAASKAYRKKIVTLNVEFYPNNDAELIKRIENSVESGETKSGYVKRLIREDIEKSNA